MRYVTENTGDGYVVHNTITGKTCIMSLTELRQYPDMVGVSDDGVQVFADLNEVVEYIQLMAELSYDADAFEIYKSLFIQLFSGPKQVKGLIEDYLRTNNNTFTIPMYLKEIPSVFFNATNRFRYCREFHSIGVLGHFPERFNLTRVRKFTATVESVPDGICKGAKYLQEAIVELVQVNPEPTQGTGCIGSNAFSGCENLSSVRILGEVSAIGAGAFFGCEKLSSVSLHGDFKRVGHFAFNASGISDIALPDSVEYLGENAFYGTKLTEFVAPTCLKSIGLTAFGCCEHLTRVDLSKTKLKRIGDRAFGVCPSLKEVLLPNTVTMIDFGCFVGSEMPEIVLPDGIEKIEHLAFMPATTLLIHKGTKTDKTVKRFLRKEQELAVKDASLNGEVCKVRYIDR